MKEPLAYRVGKYLQPYLQGKEHRAARWAIKILVFVALIIAIYFVGLWLNAELGVGSGIEAGSDAGTAALERPLTN
ncbi:MAG: hypothetical protein MK116_10635 [Phycisphaerales bacterium]|nr:hypothetical protein [Phycisphaerales bacterium]MCH2154092.1 hypothetical protein [Phycisphaerales bacterium]